MSAEIFDKHIEELGSEKFVELLCNISGDIPDTSFILSSKFIDPETKEKYKIMKRAFDRKVYQLFISKLMPDNLCKIIEEIDEKDFDKDSFKQEIAESIHIEISEKRKLQMFDLTELDKDSTGYTQCPVEDCNWCGRYYKIVRHFDENHKGQRINFSHDGRSI